MKTGNGSRTIRSTIIRTTVQIFAPDPANGIVSKHGDGRSVVGNNITF